MVSSYCLILQTANAGQGRILDLHSTLSWFPRCRVMTCIGVLNTIETSTSTVHVVYSRARLIHIGHKALTFGATYIECRLA